MKENFDNSWDYPINVFVDTQVFISQSIDLSENGKLNLLKKQVKKGAVKFYTSEIVVGEIEKHIKQNIIEKTDSLNKILKSREFSILRSSNYSDLLKEVEVNLLVNEALDIFKQYLNDVEANYLDLNTIDIKKVLSDYFRENPPFKSGKKKNEFPDAFNISMIHQMQDDSGDVVVISGDKDYENIDGIKLYKSLDAFLNEININDLVAQQALQYINEHAKDKVSDEIIEQFYNYSYELEVDGLEYDRKGIYGGYEYDEVELQDMQELCLNSIEIIDNDIDNNTITAVMRYTFKFVFDCTFLNEDNSIWDSENKDYFYREDGHIIEPHIKEIETKIIILYDYEDDDKNSYPEFDIDSIDVDINQKFNQFSLSKEGRKIVESSPMEWDYICPDCSCRITIDNYGGNGFCIRCAPNH